MKDVFKGKPPLYLISDNTISGLTHVEIFKKALASGIRIIQLREKDMPSRQLFEEAMTIKRLILRNKALFIINDYVDIAYIVDADGVHLGQDDMPLREARKILGKDKIIGISTHTLKQAIDAEDDGADYIGYGPIFYTNTKDAGRPTGISSLRRIRKHVSIPIVAIGGITIDNVREVLGAGADAVAMVSGILRGDIKTNIKRFMAVADEELQ